MEFKIVMLGSDDSAIKQESHFRKVLIHLKKYWHTILLLAPSKEGKRGFHKVDDGIWYYYFPSLWRMFLFSLSRHKLHSPIILSMDPFWYGIMAFLLKNKDQKIILELHSQYLFNKKWIKHRKRNIFYHIIARFLIPKAEKVRIVYEDEHIIKKYRNVEYVPSNYTDISLFHPDPNIRKEFDFIYVGRFHPEKNIPYLLKLFDMLSRNGYKCLIIGGKGKKTKIPKEILYKPWVPQHHLRELYRKSKILVITSYNEGGPRVAYEALASGCLVATTPTGNIFNTIKKYPECGVVLEGNIHKDIKKLEGIIKKYDDLWKKCNNKIRKELNYQKQVERYAKFVLKVMKKNTH